MVLVLQELGWTVTGAQLPDPQVAFSKEVHSSAISAANSEVAVLQPSASAKVRGAFLK